MLSHKQRVIPPPHTGQAGSKCRGNSASGDQVFMAAIFEWTLCYAKDYKNLIFLGKKNDTRVFKKVANNALSTDSFNGLILLWLFSLFRALKKHNNYFIKVPCRISTERYLISASMASSSIDTSYFIRCTSDKTIHYTWDKI